MPGRPGVGVRLRTPTDVFAHAQAGSAALRLDATEVQVRRPAPHRGGRRAFVSGKKKQNTMKATVVADAKGRTLRAGNPCPGRMHDATAIRGEGIDDLFQQFPKAQVLLRDGCSGLRKDHPGKAVTPPRKPKIAAPEVHEAREQARHDHSSQHIPVEHTLADHKPWKGPARWTHRHDTLPATYLTALAPPPTGPPAPDQRLSPRRSHRRHNHAPGRKTCPHIGGAPRPGS